MSGKGPWEIPQMAERSWAIAQPGSLEERLFSRGMSERTSADIDGAGRCKPIFWKKSLLKLYPSHSWTIFCLKHTKAGDSI